MSSAFPTLSRCSATFGLILLFNIFTIYRLQAQAPLFQTDTASGYLQAGGLLAATTPVVAGRRGLRSPVARGAALLVAGAGIWTATFAWGDEPLQQYTQRYHTAVADKLSAVLQPLGRQGLMAPLAGAASAGGVLWKDARLQKAGLVSLGGILLGAGVTSTLKNQFHRHRPNVTTENHYFDGPIPTSGNTSLPSAHTATAFAVATSVATVYGPDNKFIPPIAYGVATLVGLSRINDNVHWATDVMAGAAVGYLSARVANRLYDLADHKFKIRKQQLLIMPQPGASSGMLSATLIF